MGERELDISIFVTDFIIYFSNYSSGAILNTVERHNSFLFYTLI